MWLGRPLPPLVHVVEYDVDEEVVYVIHASALDGQAAQLLGQAVPAIELAKIKVAQFQSTKILEAEQRDGCVKGKLFVASDEL